MASEPRIRQVRSKSKFRAAGGKSKKGRLRSRPLFQKHFTYGTIFRLRRAAKRKAYGIGARSALIARQRRAVATVLRRGKRKVT